MSEQYFIRTAEFIVNEPGRLIVQGRVKPLVWYFVVLSFLRMEVRSEIYDETDFSSVATASGSEFYNQFPLIESDISSRHLKFIFRRDFQVQI